MLLIFKCSNKVSVYKSIQGVKVLTEKRIYMRKVFKLEGNSQRKHSTFYAYPCFLLCVSSGWFCICGKCQSIWYVQPAWWLDVQFLLTKAHDPCDAECMQLLSVIGRRCDIFQDLVIIKGSQFENLGISICTDRIKYIFVSGIIYLSPSLSFVITEPRASKLLFICPPPLF